MDVQLGPSSRSSLASSSAAAATSHDYYSLDPSAGIGFTGAATGPSHAKSMPPAPVAAPAPATQHPSPTYNTITDHNATGVRKMRKRKADSQENERLNKRLSLLNLEQNGQKLYVPVESPQLKPAAASSLRQIPDTDHMQLDESKHKVYIYDLDAELSDGESSSDEGKLVFLPDIAKHLHQRSRIPPRVLANSDGELAGMQLVLYSEPRSLTVPEAQDSVRKAIVEARARLRNKRDGNEAGADADATSSTMDEDTPEQRTPNGLRDLANDKIPPPITLPYSFDNSLPTAQYNPDAMDMDID